MRPLPFGQQAYSDVAAKVGPATLTAMPPRWRRVSRRATCCCRRWAQGHTKEKGRILSWVSRATRETHEQQPSSEVYMAIDSKKGCLRLFVGDHRCRLEREASSPSPRRPRRRQVLPSGSFRREQLIPL